MAALIPEIAYEETQGGIRQIEGDPQRRRIPRLRYWRGIVLFLAGAYFLIPLYAGLRFSFENDAGQFSFYAVKAIPSQTGFSAAFFLSLRLAAVTTVLTMVLMVPTATYVHLKLPKMRRVLDFVTILPIVIPPIVLILGVLEAAPLWLRASPYLLSLVYVILALPFVYRSLDAGLSAIDLKTLVEASRSLGGKWVSTLLARDPPQSQSGNAVGDRAHDCARPWRVHDGEPGSLDDASGMDLPVLAVGRPYRHGSLHAFAPRHVGAAYRDRLS